MSEEKPENRVIIDPELLLPDDPITPALTYTAVSSFMGKEFLSLAAMLKFRSRIERGLNGQTAEWQRAIELPAYVMYSVRNDVTQERLEVFAEILDPQRFVESERAAKLSVDKKRRLVQRMESAIERGWLYGKWCSRTHVEGEWGAMHRAMVQQTYTVAEFDQIQANGWVS